MINFKLLTTMALVKFSICFSHRARSRVSCVSLHEMKLFSKIRYKHDTRATMTLTFIILN